ncbi:hypothetical protein [Roseibium sp. SCP14]|uniref:hypothetical protein n=1 Tax=Roseibium sp. SCP14 TaxID=3141375 RepID=UPI00333BF272
MSFDNDETFGPINIQSGKVSKPPNDDKGKTAHREQWISAPPDRYFVEDSWKINMVSAHGKNAYVGVVEICPHHVAERRDRRAPVRGQSSCRGSCRNRVGLLFGCQDRLGRSSAYSSNARVYVTLEGEKDGRVVLHHALPNQVATCYLISGNLLFRMPASYDFA